MYDEGDGYIRWTDAYLVRSVPGVALSAERETILAPKLLCDAFRAAKSKGHRAAEIKRSRWATRTAAMGLVAGPSDCKGT